MAITRAQTDFWSSCHKRDLMRILEYLCMLLPKPMKMKMRAIKDTMALIAVGIGSTEWASAQMSWYLGHPNAALLNRQRMSTHPKMENGPELCQRKGQLMVELHIDYVRPREPPQLGAELGTQRGSTTRRNVQPRPWKSVCHHADGCTYQKATSKWHLLTPVGHFRVAERLSDKCGTTIGQLTTISFHTRQLCKRGKLYDCS